MSSSLARFSTKADQFGSNSVAMKIKCDPALGFCGRRLTLFARSGKLGGLNFGLQSGTTGGDKRGGWLEANAPLILGEIGRAVWSLRKSV